MALATAIAMHLERPYRNEESQVQKLRAFLIVALPLVAFLAALSTAPAAAASDEAKPGGLLINLTTDDTWAAAKAIFFAHDRALKSGRRPVAIWLNVQAVYLADKKRASNVPGVMRGQDKSIQDMLAAFMNDGGQVIMCMACSQAVGLTEADYIDGVQMGNWELMESLLFDPDIKTLSW